ncbi:sensor histidine kinase [Actinoplanes nipponensis]|uniref:sensor histidine kinase n=1 Tax=Actinoplanes nipponensis TaxID=135950 RepID=UPI001EF1B809|nr:histidine kinase [Actinoplanes nipponensis]
MAASQVSGPAVRRQWGVRAAEGGDFPTLRPRFSGWPRPPRLLTVDDVDICFFPMDRMTTGRSICHLLIGAALSMLAAAMFTLLVILWGAALVSLVSGPSGGALLVVLYVLAGLTLPLVLAWFVHEVAVLHRLRFQRLLDVTIPEPAWTLRSTGRQLAYHTWALLIAVPATALILAPPAARRFVRHDRDTARRLLGPTNVEILKERVDWLRRSRAEIVLATDEERRRIERDLHDGAQQRLLSLALNLGMAREAITEPSPEADAIVAAHDEALSALSELRQFVRGLHPAVLNDRGLDAAISGLAARAKIPIHVSVTVQPRCPPSIEAVAYFVVSEALTNVAKHSRALIASVTITRRGSKLHIEVADEGRGGATAKPGGGIAGLIQRTASVDGTLTLSSPVGGPTVIKVVLPCG